MRRNLVLCHYASAAFGLVFAITMAMAMGTFACDAPNADRSICYGVGAGTLVITVLLFVVLPLWAARRVKDEKPYGLALSVINSLLAPWVLPIGPVLGVAQLYMAWRLWRSR